jgi:UDP-GlcNAc:undecaprenyl-phosphate GlcNAc-1-phosphate transferase
MALVALLLAAVLIPLLRPLALRLGLADHPGGRKQHEAPTPMHGGLSILVAMLATGAAFGDFSSASTQAFYLAGGLLLVVGVLDDRWDLNWRVRIGAQIVATLIMVFLGAVSVQQLSDVFGVPGLTLGWLSLPVTVFVVVGMINALNMSDGVDGLAGGQALVSILLFTGFALYAGNVVTAERLLVIAGAIIGFLVWNLRRPGLPRAGVFLGDAGSMVLGFVIAWTSVRLSQNPLHPVSPVLGPWTIALPLIDCVSLIFRRWRQGRSPFAGDRDHLHHLLLDAGYSPSQVTLGLMAVSAMLGLSAAIALKAGINRPLLVLIFLALIAVHYFMTADRERAVGFFRRLRTGSASADQA